jgi:hypothetical protein
VTTPFSFVSSNGSLVFTSSGNPNVVGVPSGPNYTYTFSTANATYVEQNNTPVDFEVISFSVSNTTGIRSISGGIYREASSLTSLNTRFANNSNIELYDPGLNFGGTHIVNLIETFAGSSIQTFRLQEGASFGANAIDMTSMFDNAANLSSFIIPENSSFGANATVMSTMFASTGLASFTIPNGAQFGASLESIEGLFTNNLLFTP